MTGWRGWRRPRGKATSVPYEVSTHPTHLLQSEHETEPLEAVYVPTLQASQEEAPVDDEIVPAAVGMVGKRKEK